MHIEAHFNNHAVATDKDPNPKPIQGDLLLTISDRSAEWVDFCTHAQSAWIADPSFDHVGRMKGEIVAHIGRDLTDDESKAIDAAIKAAKVTDGIDEVLMAEKRALPVESPPVVSEPEPEPEPESVG